MRLFLSLVLLAPMCAFSQLGGPGQYPQFRSMSGLPGSGFGVSADGKVDLRGAMSLSAPIGYSLSDWEIVLAIGNLSANRTPTFPRGSEKVLRGNGTGTALLGIPLGEFGSATVSHMVLSNRGDFATNVAWSPPRQTGPVRIALGVQDVSGQGGTQGEGANGQDPGESRSYFAAGTWHASERTHVSLGIGDTRFRRGFASVSQTIGDRAKAVLEHDGYNWNVGVAFDVPLGQGERDSGVTFALGLFRGDFAYWSAAIRF
ncbi:MAG: hypothetical protein AB7F50_12110 [Fimbriimonadaceae bacterium]